MPYIDPKSRKRLDSLINMLATRITTEAMLTSDPAAFAGLLNYVCTEIALKVIYCRFGNIRYWLIATVTGIFHNIADEFYRRVAAPYEDEQIAKNGDLELFQGVCKWLNSK